MTKIMEQPITAHRESTPDTQKTALWNFLTPESTYSTTIFDDKTQCSRLENHTYTYDTASGVHSYGYRYYSSALGRWISRDPLGEHWGLNLFCMIQNRTINVADVDGRGPIPWWEPKPTPLPPPDDFETIYPPWGPPWGVVVPIEPGPENPGVPTIPVLSCIEELLEQVYNLLVNQASGSQAHCLASCKVAGACGEDLTLFIGASKELVELLFSNILDPPDVTAETILDSAQDMLDNQTGADCAKDECRTCKQCCDDELP